MAGMPVVLASRGCRDMGLPALLGPTAAPTMPARTMSVHFAATTRAVLVPGRGIPGKLAGSMVGDLGNEGRSLGCTVRLPEGRQLVWVVEDWIVTLSRKQLSP